MSEDLGALDLAHLWHPFTPHVEWGSQEPLVIVGAEGNTLIDIHGRRYIDGVSSLWTNVHGHCHPDLDRALSEQLGKMAHSTLLGLTHPPAIRLAAELVRRAPDGLTRVFYSDNGSTAVEVAIKIAYQAQQHRGERQRIKFAGLSDAYHGDTLGAVSVGAIPQFHAIFRPLLFDAIALPAPTSAGGEEEARCLAVALDLLERHAAELAAFVYEPLVQGAAGMKMHSPHFIATLARAARERGILLVADEVAVGFGRTGTMFASEQVGIAPDLLCVAKGLAAGYLPLAATLATERLFSDFLAEPHAGRHLFHGHTFSGNPLACAVALESLALFDRNDVLAHVARIGEVLEESLHGLRSIPTVHAIRRRGVMIGIDLRRHDGAPFHPSRRMGHRVSMACREHGAIVRPLGDTLVLNPPLSLREDEARRLVALLGECLSLTG